MRESEQVTSCTAGHTLPVTAAASAEMLVSMEWLMVRSVSVTAGMALLPAGAALELFPCVVGVAVAVAAGGWPAAARAAAASPDGAGTRGEPASPCIMHNHAPQREWAVGREYISHSVSHDAPIPASAHARRRPALCGLREASGL